MDESGDFRIEAYGTVVNPPADEDNDDTAGTAEKD